MKLLSPTRLPVSLRPYRDEALSSWLSRAAAVYNFSARELLFAYEGTQEKAVVNLDLDVSPVVMDLVHTLAGCDRADVSACSLATAHPYLLPDWVGRLLPHWHTSIFLTIPE